MALRDGRELLARLRARLAADGLHIALPLAAADFHQAVRPVNGPRLGELLDGGRAAIIVGDGGPTFFQKFRRDFKQDVKQDVKRRSGEGEAVVVARDPLDDYTRQVLARAVPEAWAGADEEIRHCVLYPFVERDLVQPALPFQRLGAAAGLPDPGPLGLQIHPTFGPWWAYRAALVVSFALSTEAVLAASCAGCARPCVATCPARAVRPAGFSFPSCLEHRAAGPPCRESCAARIACPVGEEQRYSAQQLAFHMRASWDLSGR